MSNLQTPIKATLKFLVTPFVLVLFLIISFPSSILAVENPQSLEMTVSATIGEPKLILFGYSSPNSLIQLQGKQVAEETIADESGYFLFDRIFLPLPNPDYPELCLNAIDIESRTSFPTCLPNLPLGPYNISVGPVLLSPTISLEKGYFLPKELINAQGLTIPNTEITIFLANEAGDKKAFFSKIQKILFPTVFAYSLPQYKIKADSQGRFDFNLPTVKQTNWRLFASSHFQGSPSPKSNSLNFKVLNWWEWLWLVIINVFGAFLRLVRPYLWLIVVLSQILIAIILLKHKNRTKEFKKEKNKAWVYKKALFI
jgi:hypothetical protein